MSIPARESTTFTMGQTTWEIKKGTVGDVWSVEITCPQFKFPRFEFLLPKHGSGMIISEIVKQVATRIMCNNHKFYRDFPILFAIICENAELFDIPLEFLNELRETNKNLYWFTVTPWIKDDYESVLKELRLLGFNVELVRDKEYLRATTDWYVFSPQDRPIWVPARIPMMWTKMGNFDDMENEPYCSLEYVLEDLTETLRRQHRDLNELKNL